MEAMTIVRVRALPVAALVFIERSHQWHRHQHCTRGCLLQRPWLRFSQLVRGSFRYATSTQVLVRVRGGYSCEQVQSIRGAVYVTRHTILVFGSSWLDVPQARP